MITITDGQTDVILDDITEDSFWNDNHHKSLKDSIETFDFTTFADKPYSKYLSDRNRVIIPGEDGEYIEFIITNQIKRRLNSGALSVEVYTSASYILLAKAKVIRPQTLQGATAENAAQFAVDGTEWQVGQVDYKGISSIKIEKHTNPYSLLKQIASEFGLELRFRVETGGNKITGRYVDLLERVGSWQGREVEFGKDLASIERKEDASNIVTALLGIGPEREDGTRLEVLVTDDDSLQRWGRRHPQTGELMHIIEKYEPQTTDQEMTEERLRELTQNELKKRVNTLVEYIGEVVDIEKEVGLEHEKFRFGDTIRIKDTSFIPPLYLEARIHTQDRSIKKKNASQKKVTLGDYIEYTEEQVQAAWKALEAQIKDRLSKLAIVNINASAGTVFKNGIGTTDLKAIVYQNGQEVDQSGQFYKYKWDMFDKSGNYVTSIYTKQITVNAVDIDEKSTYIVTVSKDGEEMSSEVVTVTNVNDGSEGAPGRSIETITEYFLATSANSGVTRSTPGWTTTFQPVTNEKKYLWSYKKITYKNPTGEEYIEPVIIGVYGDKGDTGQNATSYWLVCNVAAIQKSMSGVYTPTTITVTAKSQTGTGSPTNYAGRFIILESTDGTSFTVKYTSTANEATKTYTPSAGIKAIKVQLYLAGGITTILDEETIPILADVADMQDAVKNAQSTADGKNTVFYQATAPSTAGRKINDLWYDTDDGYKPYRFDGSDWIPAPFGNAAIANLDAGKITTGEMSADRIKADVLSAITADLGTVIAGIFKNSAGTNVIDMTNGTVKFGGGNFSVDANGNVTINGTFTIKSGSTIAGTNTSDIIDGVNKGKQVYDNTNNATTKIDGDGITVKDGSFFLEDKNSETKYSTVAHTNLIKDHSFEMVLPDGEPDATDGTFKIKTYSGTGGGPFVNSNWKAVGNSVPKLHSIEGTEDIAPAGTFGYKALLVNVANWIAYDFYDISPGATFTLSAHFSRHYAYPGVASGGLRFRLYREEWDGTIPKRVLVAEATRAVDAPDLGGYMRGSITETLPNYDTNYFHWLECDIFGTTTNWIRVDGVQLVRGAYPTLYAPEDNFWHLVNDRIPANVISVDSLNVYKSLKLFNGLIVQPHVHEMLSLQNGWQNYFGYVPGAYTKTPDGYVHLRGLVHSGSYGSVIGYLPAGCRPMEKEMFPSVDGINGLARVDVYPDGRVQHISGNTAYISLSGISFRAEN